MAKCPKCGSKMEYMDDVRGGEYYICDECSQGYLIDHNGKAHECDDVQYSDGILYRPENDYGGTYSDGNEDD